MIYYKFDYTPLSLNTDGNEVKAVYHFLNNGLKNHILLMTSQAFIYKRLLIKGMKFMVFAAIYDCGYQGDMTLTLVMRPENQPKLQLKTVYSSYSVGHYYA